MALEDADASSASANLRRVEGAADSPRLRNAENMENEALGWTCFEAATVAVAPRRLLAC